ncbi:MULTISPECIES: DUF2130 domain-containing protein [Helicobacter]|mgnify:FL=1|uniref:DUF2130 domain-containing protein n=3 Tax=Helicobacter TaxID=209 RepID=A0A3D8IA67_9HELI|nr:MULTISPECIES: DUF2130 domain-containing protein [Helicobacter]RDU62042.1 DUF2130 domain-containing protein [Helicobacter ganmani]
MNQENSIKCPNCGKQIDVQAIVYHQIEQKIYQENLESKKQFETEIAQKRKEYKQAFEALQAEQESLQEKVQQATKESLKQERQKLQESLKQEFAQEYQEALKTMQKELEEKSNQVRELNLSKAEIEKLKREKGEIESKIKAQEQERLAQEMASFKEKLHKEIESQNELRFREKEQQLEGLKKQLQEAQRKVEIGSQQLQGEVQELAIEEYLQVQFPLDDIVEIKKGAHGGDCVQIVHTREIPNCGKIYYESKRTKEFQRAWIEKFKADMRKENADVGVIVSQTMPKELERMGLLDGVWICTFEEFKALCAVLREGVIRVQIAQKSQENKQDKMGLLYQYLTSSEFKMQIEAIVEGFTQMQSDLDSEKRAMQRLWKQREKQIQKVLENTIDMYGSIKGIAGNAIGNVKALEIPFNENLIEDSNI